MVYTVEPFNLKLNTPPSHTLGYGVKSHFGMEDALFSMAESVFNFTPAAVFSLPSVSEGFAVTNPKTTPTILVTN